jgi:hypothetical protein
MGWSYGQNNEGREVGYAVDAVCDKDGCDASINRGLAYVCGGMHDGDEHGCGRYVCSKHLVMGCGLPSRLCEECADRFEVEHPEVVAAAAAQMMVRMGA